MNKSESINELAAALSQLQGEIIDAHKDTQGHGYKYATLGSVLEIARPLLLKNSLAVTQLCGTTGDKITVETVLMHSSGQWVSETLAFDLPEKSRNTKAQDSGSVITYMRRYSLTALLGITQTDDDAAVKEEAPKKQSEPKRAVVEFVQPDTLKALLAYMAAHDTSQETIDTWLSKFNVKGIRELPETFAQYLLKKFKEKEENMHHEAQQATQGDDCE